MSQYSYMQPEHAAETEATEREYIRLKNERPELSGDALLNAATEAAGYDVGDTGVECCNQCEAFYHRDYGCEYVDPWDLSDLVKECGVTEDRLRLLEYRHYCDLDCLKDALNQLP